MIFWKFFVFYLITFKLIKLDFKNKANLGKKGQFIIANHPSLLDVLFFISSIKKLNCITKKDLLKNPIMIGALLSCGYIIKSDPEKLIKACHDALKNQCLLVFPEGTRTGTDGIIKLNKGTLSIGLRSAKIITPVIIKMDQQIFKKKQPWYKIPNKIINYKFIVCDDIDPKDWLDKYPLPVAAKKISNHLQNLFKKELSL